MVPFVLAAGMILFVLAIVAAFLVWAFRQWRQAQKYRYLMRLHALIPKEELRAPINKVPAWEVTFRGKRPKQRIEADTESELMRVLFSRGIDYKTIENFRKL